MIRRIERFPSLRQSLARRRDCQKWPSCIYLSFPFQDVISLHEVHWDWN